ncbi:MAG: MFS transporter [Bacillota bacterium]
MTLESDQPLWKMVLALMMARAFAMFFTGSFGPLTPFLVAEFDLTESQIGLCSSAIYAGALLCVLPAGRYMDTRNVRGPLTAGILMVPVMLLALSRTGSLALMVLVFFLSGIPRSLILPATEKAVAQIFTGAGRASAMGVTHSGPPLVGSLLSVILPAFAVAFSWRTGVGTVALVLIPLALWLRMVLGKIGLENDTDQKPDQDMGHFLRNPDLVLPGLICAILQSGHIILLTFFALYVSQGLALSPVDAGIYLGTAQMVAVAARPLGGVASDRLFGGRRELPLALMGLTGAACFALLGLLPEHPPRIILTLVSAVLGATIISARPLVSTFAIERAGLADAAKVSSVLLITTWVPFIAVPPLFGYAVTAAGSWTGPWIAAACFIGLSAVLPFLQPRRKRGGTPARDRPST